MSIVIAKSNQLGGRAFVTAIQGGQGAQGIQGIQGDQGVKGDQGIQGIQGEASAAKFYDTFADMIAASDTFVDDDLIRLNDSLAAYKAVSSGGNIDNAGSQSFVKLVDGDSEVLTLDPMTLAINEQFIGQGRRKTVFTVTAGTGVAINTPDSSGARNMLSGVGLVSAGSTKTPGDIGIDAGDSSFGLWIDYSILGFDTGFIDNATPDTSSFSARNLHMAYEVNTCNTGVMHFGANASSWVGGRVWNCTVGHDMDDAEALSFFGENTESCDTAFKARNSRNISLFGGFIEAGGAGDAFNLDSESSVSAFNVKVNGARGDTEKWDPNFSEWHLDAKDTNKSLARISFIPDASKQYFHNSDFSLPLSEGWTVSNVTDSFDTTVFESGTRSVKLIATSTAGYIRKQFSIERDVAVLSFGARIMPMGNQTIRTYVTDGTSTLNPVWVIPAYSAWASGVFKEKGDVVTDGGYSYRSLDDHTTGGSFAGDAAHWEENWITLVPRFDVEDSSADIDFRIYPDVIGGTGTIYVDQAWGVRGHFTSAPRLHRHGHVYLDTPIDLASGVTTANTNIAYTLAGAGADIPTGAIGYIVRLKLKGTAAATYACANNLFTNGMAVHPRLNNVNAAAEFTILNLSGDTVSITTGSGSNTTTYSADLIGWVVE